MPIKIYVEGESETLRFHEGDRLANRKEYDLSDRCIGSIFEALQPGDIVELQEGVFSLNENLDLI